MPKPTQSAQNHIKHLKTTQNGSKLLKTFKILKMFKTTQNGY